MRHSKPGSRAFFQNAVLGHGGQGNINLRKSMQPRCLSDAASSLQFRLLFHTCCQRVTVWLSRMNRLACPRTTEHLGCHGIYMCSVGLQLRERFQTPIQDIITDGVTPLGRISLFSGTTTFLQTIAHSSNEYSSRMLTAMFKASIRISLTRTCSKSI